jgi:tetratricopeptide (TPR) repeat protein
MKPTLFIGSSVEGLQVANSVHQNLRFVAEVTVWDQGVFQLSKTNLESLDDALTRSDFGVFVFSPDDIINIRGEQNRAVRDNVILELGLFAGRLGRERCFILLPENCQDVHLPTDLIGMTPALSEVGRSDGSMQAATGPACQSIRSAIQSLGLRRDRQQGSTADSEPSKPSERDKAEQGEPTALSTSTEGTQDTAPSKRDWFIAYVTNKFQDALTLLDDAIKGLPQGEERIELESWRGRVQNRLDPLAGTQILEKLIEKYPASCHPYLHLANSRGDANEALRIVDRGIAVAKPNHGLVLGKAHILEQTGREPEAIEVLKQAITVDPTVASYYYRLATIQKESGQENEMRSTLEAGIKSCPDAKELLSFYAEELFNGTDKKLALIPYNRLVRLDPTNTKYLARRGNLYLELDLHDLAMRAYKEANELAEGKEAWILANIGNLYKNRGFFAEGIEYLKKAIAINPDDEYAHQRLGAALELRQKEEELLATQVKEAQKALVAQQLRPK